MGFLLVYNICSESTFDEVKVLRGKIIRAKEDEKVPIVLAGNKCDLRDPNNPKQVTKKKGAELAATWGVPFFETSAKEKINNEDCFYEVVRQIRKMEEKDSANSKTKSSSRFCQIL